MDWTNTIFSNTDGEVWLGTDKSGISYFNGTENPLHYYSFEPLQNNRQSKVSGIVELPDEQFLMGIFKHSNLIVFDPSSEVITRNIELPHGLYINDLIEHKGKIYFTSNEGFGYITKDLKLVFLHDADLNISHNYQRPTFDALGQLWMIQWNYGICMFNGENHHFPGGQPNSVLRNAWNHDLCLGPDNFVWIGSQNGLYRVNPQSLEMECIAHADSLGSLKNANIKTLLFDDTGSLWLSSFGKGLTGFKVEGPSLKPFKDFDSRNGLPSDRVYDMIKDQNGYFWIWTNEGLTHLDPAVNSMKTIYYPETRNLNVDKNGIWFGPLNHYRDVYFGFVNGFSVFTPEELMKSKPVSKLKPVITDFTSLTDQLNFGEAINTNQVHLSPRQNQFNIQFSAPSYSNNTQVQYRYRLDGLQDEWTYSTVKQINYSNVPAGYYTFHLEASNDQSSWTSLEQPFQISIATIWYKTWWASLLWFLTIVGIMILIYRFFLSRQKIQEALAYQSREASHLRKLNQIKSNFFAQISHEFRTPLTIILGMADRLRENFQNESKDELNAIEDNAHVLLNEINRILDLAKLESSKPSINLQQGDLRDFVKFTIESFRSFLSLHEIRLEYNAPEEPIVLDFDPQILGQILNNLLSNAIKFSPAGSTIRLEVEEDSSQAVIKIKDNGPGIAADELEHIFDPYFRGENTQQKPGSGLGLALVDNWVKLMKGHIDAKSELGKGSTFEIRFPITADSKTPLWLISSTRPKSSKIGPIIEVDSLTVTRDTDSPTLLIVEDHFQMAEYIKSILSLNFNCLTAQHGKEGIQLAMDHIPDIIVSDVMMPFMDGYEFVKSIKQNRITDHIPVVLVTAKADNKSKIEGLEYGADAYITKPFNKTELLLTLKNLYALRSKNQNNIQNRINQSELIEIEPQHPILLALEEFILTHTHEESSVDQLANHVKLSRSQLYRKIKAITGLSISRYVRNIRLTKAHQLLQASDMNVSEIAYAVGYADPNYFSRIYSEDFGSPPSESKSQIKA